MGGAFRHCSRSQAMDDQACRGKRVQHKCSTTCACAVKHIHSMLVARIPGHPSHQGGTKTHLLPHQHGQSGECPGQPVGALFGGQVVGRIPPPAAQWRGKGCSHTLQITRLGEIASKHHQGWRWCKSTGSACRKEILDCLWLTPRLTRLP